MGDDEIKSNSKYKAYYDELIQTFKSSNCRADRPSPPNSFYSPKLFDLIREKLYLMPLWSGVMIRHTALVTGNEYLRTKSRLDNNPVENHFGHVKVHECLKRKIYPSEYVIYGYKRIKSKHAEHYSVNSTTIKNNFEIKKSNLAMHKSETWNKGRNSKSKFAIFS